MEQLEAMNAPKDSVVTIHTALRAVGETEGRGDGFLDALIEYFTLDGGLLMVPTHTWGFLKEKPEYALDLTCPRSNLGTLPSLAAVRKDGHRSEHPTHSVTLFGEAEKAEAFISGDGQTESCTSPLGCYGKLYDRGGKVLLIGVGQEKNTFLHCVEEIIGVPNRLDRNLRSFRVRRADGSTFENRIHFVHAEGIRDVSAYFPKLEPAFRYYGCITDGQVGNAKAMLCDAVKMKQVMELILERSKGRELLSNADPLEESLYVQE